MNPEKFQPGRIFEEMCEIYQDNYTPEKKVIICNEGSSRCFHAGTDVITSKGTIPISEIKKGDKVLTYNEQLKTKEFKPVNEALKFRNKKPCYKITLKNGKEIICTRDHEFYYEGSWHSLKHIVSLWNDSKESRNINKRKEDREVF